LLLFLTKLFSKYQPGPSITSTVSLAFTKAGAKMKRLVVIFVVLSLLVTAGCGEQASSKYAEVAVEQQVILEQDGLTVMAQSLDLSGAWGPRLKIRVENSRNSSVILQVRDLAINDIVVDDLFYCEVEAGKAVNDEIIFISTDLETAGIEVIKNIEFKFHVRDAGTWDTLFDSEALRITTTADPSLEQAHRDSGFPVLERSGFRAVASYHDSEESPWGAEICIYMENNSDRDAIFQVKEISVNGIMVEPIFLSEVPAGKMAYNTITFLKSELADNNIKSIDELKLRFQIIDRDSGDTILESEEATVTFTERSLSEKGGSPYVPTLKEGSP
jgi:hypothetical protein